jgi:sugar phosphate isomerase/epimerase
MGVVIHSYWMRRGAEKGRGFEDPLTFLDYCRTLGAGGVQTSLGVRDDAYAAKLHDLLAAHKLYLEGSIALPRDEADVERFTAEVRTAKRCGVTVFRTVLMNGRRYEVFDSAEAFQKFFAQGQRALAWARPVVEKHEVRMAVENHKDLQAPALLDLIKKLDSPYVGVCIDTGNNIALLETPQETVELLAPHAFTTHIKDMGVEEYADGFLLAEVPLGTGFLDLPKIVATVRAARPAVRLNLEMMTRDPLKIPCLTPRYWVTLDSLPGRRLAAMLALVRARAGKKPLPRISGLSKEEQLRREDDNVRQCLEYARQHLE